MIHKSDGGFFDRTNDETSLGGYPHAPGTEVPDEIGGIFVGSDVAAVVTALRVAGQLPQPEPFVPGSVFTTE